MEILRRDGACAQLRANGERLQKMFAHHLDSLSLTHRIISHPTLFGVVFTEREVRTYRDMLAADARRSAKFNAVPRENGIFKPPGKVYPGLALTEDDFALT